MDSLASLALGLEPPTDDLLERPPYGKRRPMISRTMITFILGHGVFQLSVMFAILFNPYWLPDNVEKFPPPDVDIHAAGDSVHWTMIFNTFVLMQLANEINARKLPTPERLRSTWWEWNQFGGIHRNPTFVVIILVTFALQVIFVQLTGPVFKCKPLTANQWGFCIGWGLAEFPFQWVINGLLLAQDKWCSRKSKDGFNFDVEPEDHLLPDDEGILGGSGVHGVGYEVDSKGEIHERPDAEVVPINEMRLQQAKQWMGSKRHSQIEEQKIQEFGKEFIRRSSTVGARGSKATSKDMNNLTIDELIRQTDMLEAEKRKAHEQAAANPRNSGDDTGMTGGAPSKEQ